MKNSILILGLILPQSLLIAANNKNVIPEMPGLLAKMSGEVAQSKLVCWYSQRVSPKMRPTFGTELAGAKYQSLGQEAQATVGVPKGRVLLIKKLILNSSAVSSAQAEGDAIFINEAKIESRSFGAQRVLFFHEACHAKYNDTATAQLAGLIAGVFGAGTINLLVKLVKPVDKRNFLDAVVPVVIFGLARYYIEKKVLKFAESRADFEGCYASQCSVCVEEEAEYTSRHYLPCHKNQGYLSPSGLIAIANDLGRQNKKCIYHQFASDSIVTKNSIS